MSIPTPFLLWVAVKGFPENKRQTQPATQARHWFSQAIFDLVCYHGENSIVSLALEIPDVRRTYRNLLKKTEWFPSIQSVLGA